EVERHPLTELSPGSRGGELVQRLLNAHHRPNGPGGGEAASEARAHLDVQHAIAPVVLEGDLAKLDSELGGSLRVEDLLDLLELNEMRARAHRSETQARQLDRHPGELAPHTLHAAVWLDAQATAFLDAVELRRVQAIAVDREAGAFRGAAHHLVRREHGLVGGRIRINGAKLLVEAVDRLR